MKKKRIKKIAAKAVSEYIERKKRFAKFLLLQLPFLQGTLPSILLRDFYKKEGDYKPTKKK